MPDPDVAARVGRFCQQHSCWHLLCLPSARWSYARPYVPVSSQLWHFGNRPHRIVKEIQWVVLPGRRESRNHYECRRCRPAFPRPSATMSRPGRWRRRGPAMASAIVWATSTGRPFLRRARSLGFSIDYCRQLMGPGPQPRQPRCARNRRRPCVRNRGEGARAAVDARNPAKADPRLPCRRPAGLPDFGRYGGSGAARRQNPFIRCNGTRTTPTVEYRR